MRIKTTFCIKNVHMCNKNILLTKIICKVIPVAFDQFK